MPWIDRLVPQGPLRFVLVGGLAAAVHYAAALCLHGLVGVPAAWANVLAFGCAFPVSYVGHRVFSFPSVRLRHRQALPRFFVVAVGCFGGNQALLLALLQWWAWPFWLALGCALVTVALTTYGFSRYWAFR